ncbi:DUF2085 domain-containing protein [Candidatus Hecatella orcuttiae]|uniref:DUF2085 domain-containing protein n=1 Tax=Candidatus Hecatella orcuttiae TaxID=1935119 RepID=UPI002867FB2D|nr:DUF2085 domain-containing protein [Candidatus Hecatella orcuttiae]
MRKKPNGSLWVKVLNWESLLSHRHWVTLRLGGKDIHICARCLGVYMGFSSLIAATALYEVPLFHGLSFPYQVFFCILLLFPAAFDWLTQTWGFRKGTNRWRVSTGFLEGVAVALLSLTAVSLALKVAVVLFVGFSIVYIGFLGRRLKPRLHR